MPSKSVSQVLEELKKKITEEVERQRGDGKIATPGAIQMIGWTAQMVVKWAVDLALDNPPGGRRGSANGAGERVSLGSKDFGLGPTIHTDSHGRTTSGGRGPSEVPPGERKAPNRLSVVEEVNSEHPGLIKDNFAFTLEVARRLNLEDPNFGLNGKRGNPNNPSKDAITYKNPDVRGGAEVYDIISGRDGPHPKPSWNFVGAGGLWLDPWAWG